MAHHGGSLGARSAHRHVILGARHRSAHRLGVVNSKWRLVSWRRRISRASSARGSLVASIGAASRQLGVAQLFALIAALGVAGWRRRGISRHSRGSSAGISARRSASAAHQRHHRRSAAKCRVNKRGCIGGSSAHRGGGSVSARRQLGSGSASASALGAAGARGGVARPRLSSAKARRSASALSAISS